MMYKVIGGVIHTIVGDYICLDYYVLIKENVSKKDNNFENTKFNCLYQLGLYRILMNIMPCHEFARY